MLRKTISLDTGLLLLLLVAVGILCVSCYRMPTDNDYSVIPVTNNRDITGEGEKDENNVLPTLNY